MTETETLDFTWQPTPSALTFGRLMRLSPALGMQVSQTLQARRGRAWERDKDVLARIERAETPEALVDLVPHLGGLSGPSWLARVKAFSPQIIPLLAERLKAVHAIRDEDEREMRYKHLTDAFYVCGLEAAPALLACFDELGDDEYGKSQVAMALGMLGYQESADAIWAFYRELQNMHGPITDDNANLFIGPLWGLVDLGDPRAADALSEILDQGYFFYSVFAMAHRAGDERLVLPLLWTMAEGDEAMHNQVPSAVSGIAHRIGREALLDALEETFGGEVPRSKLASMADNFLRIEPRISEAYFAYFFEAVDMKEVGDINAMADRWERMQDSGPSSLARPPASEAERPGRNDPCWCGSGKKYKHCHWREDMKRVK